MASSLQTGQEKTVGSFFLTILMTRLRRRPMLISLDAWVMRHLFQRSMRFWEPLEQGLSERGNEIAGDTKLYLLERSLK